MRVYGVPLKGEPFIVSGESGSVTFGALMFIMERPELKELRERLGLNSTSQVPLINPEGNTVSLPSGGLGRRYTSRDFFILREELYNP